MRFFLCVRLEDFFVKELIRREPALEHETLVVLEEGRVLDLSDDAKLRGIVVGMPKSQAKALIRGGRFIEREKGDFIEAQRAWLDRLVPFSDIIEPLDQHEAIVDLSRHPRPSEIASLAIASVAELHPRVGAGCGPSTWIAKLATGQKQRDVSDPKRFLAELPIGVLGAVGQGVKDKLQGLGYSTVGQLQEVPLTVLLRQFKAEGQVLHRLAHGTHFEAAKALYPENALGSYLAFEGGTESLETLELGFLDLASELGARLSAQERETAEVQLHIEHEKRVLTRARTFSKSVSDARTLGVALKLLLTEAPEEPVFGLRVTLPRLKRVKRVQSSLFVQRNESRDRLDSALARVRTVFGENTVMLATDFEIPRRVRLLQEMGSLVGWR